MPHRPLTLALTLCLAAAASAQQSQTAGNALAGAASRYLRDAAASQVAWRPWGQAAFEVARRANRPLFVSLGYASSYESFRLHRESFGNPIVAETLNGYYIPVLVDRFEQPEVAAAFDALQIAMTGTATIPSSFVLTPDLEPFAVTAEVPDVFLATNASRWANEREAAIAEGRANLAKARPLGAPALALTHGDLRKLATDPRRDLLGGGFHRSATELEKLLPEQARIATAALEAWQTTREPLFEQLVRTTLDYVVRDLHLDQSGFYAAQDAYSLVPGQGPETHDGAFYAKRPGETFEQRQKRPQPFRDFTEYAGWNGLTFSALARAGAVLGEPRYRDAAATAARGVTARLWNAKTKTLLRSDRVPATAEDQAMLVQGLLDLFNATYEVKWLELARAIHEAKTPPAGASLPAALRRLVIESEELHAIRARNHQRLAFPKVVVVTGDFRRRETHELLHSVHQTPDPLRTVVFLPVRGPERIRVTTALPWTAGLAHDPEKPIAYVCENGQCRRM